MRAAGAVAVAFLWALCYPLVTVAVDHAPPLQVAALRALLAGLALVSLAAALGRRHPRGLQWAAVVAIGGCFTGLAFAGMFLAGGRVTPGIATIIANTQPLLAAWIGVFVLGERITARQAVGMGVAFAGIAFLAVPTLLPSGPSSVSVSGVAFVLLGALGVAVGNVLMKRFAARLDVISATGWQLLVGSVFLFLASRLWGSSEPIRWTAPFVGALVGLALPGTALAFALWFALLRRAPLNSINMFTFLTPLFALGIAVTWFDERWGATEVIGTVLVLTGAWAGFGTAEARDAP